MDRQMDNLIKIGKSILDNYSDYADTAFLDDEAEYLPTLKVIIEGILETVESSVEKEKIESIFIDHLKQHYVSLWIKHTMEDEEDPDIDYEKSRAIDEFERLYYD
jgi:uridine kinase